MNISLKAKDGIVDCENDSRTKGSRLWSNDCTRCSRSCNRNFPELDLSGGWQSDLHKPNRQRRNSSQEASLSANIFAKFSSLSNSHLFSLLKPRNPLSISAGDQLTVNHISSNSAMSVEDHGESTAALCADSSPSSLPSTPTKYFSSEDISLTNCKRMKSSQRDSSRSSKTRGLAPFCPCFSPTSTDSDSDEGYGHNASIDLQVHDALRIRLAITGEASNQLPLTSHAPEAPVHKIVEYTNHLVPDMEKIYSSTYYWGAIDRFQAESLLDGKAEGTFLLRDSAQTEYLFSVSFRRFQRTLHARVEQGNHRFGFDILDNTTFSAISVTALIENYKDVYRCMFFEPQLTLPLHRKHVFSLQELCRSVIASRTSYTKVSELGLPQKLKEYIRHYHYTIPVRTVYNQLN